MTEEYVVRVRIVVISGATSQNMASGLVNLPDAGEWVYGLRKAVGLQPCETCPHTINEKSCEACDQISCTYL
jgi:hypothetical protein